MAATFRLYPSASCIVIEHEGRFTQANPDFTLDLLFSVRNPSAAIEKALSQGQPTDAPGASWPLVQSQEVWTALDATASGAVYGHGSPAERPPLMLKATPHRVAPPGGGVRLRADAQRCVAEPVLSWAINAAGRIFGYTLGHDLTALDVAEGDPLHLPQAKCYDRSAALGPCLVVSAEPLDVATDLKLRITRRGKDVWETNLRSDAVAEKAPDLADWLWRGNMFPFGAYLMTGPVVAWPEGFSLRPGDQVYLTHESIGTLSNMVVN